MVTEQFINHLYNELNKDSEKDNIFFSPFSVSMAISMVLHGSMGSTKDQLMSVLGFTTDSQLLKDQKEIFLTLNSNKSSVEMNVANSLFPEESFSLKKSYVNQLKDILDCQVQGLNYKTNYENSRKEINSWVLNKTKNKIDELIPSGCITPDTVLVLVNAIYFKGMWKDMFEKRLTQKQTFYCLDGSEKQVQMMAKKSHYMSYYDASLKVNCLELPYRGDQFSMYIFVPEERLGIKTLEKDLSVEKMNLMIDGCQREEFMLKIPKFKLEYTKMLEDTLQAIGIHDMFDASKANFKGITDVANLCISSVVHKSFIEVNEEGTEAAAATGMMMMRMCLPLPPIEITCDHPFILLITHKPSKQIIFYGKIANIGE